MKKNTTVFMIILVSVTFNLYSQNEGISPGIVGDKFSDFTLQTYQGDKLSTSKLHGKNILLISSRGKYNENAWCALCNYQYADFADLELKKQIRKKYNMEVVFLLPYNKDTIASWEKAFPGSLASVEKWKNPGDPENLSDGQKGWMEFTRAHYPKTFDYTNKKVPLPFPILIDDKQEVSKGLDIFRTEWGGTKTMQNIPTVFIIDKDGILRFKYISQSTIDRPSAEYILNFIDKNL
jgi:peroxiredoxin